MLTSLFSNSKPLKENVLGINQRNVDLIFSHNQRKHYKLADDKAETKLVLEPRGLSCPITYAMISNIGGIESKWKKLRAHHSLVIKPAKGSGGGGILVLHKKEGDWYKGSSIIQEREIFSHIANIIFGVYSFGDSDRAIIEQCIQPHAFFGNIYSEGVPDVRIITVKGVPVLGMLRLPTEASDGKANLHQGGLGVGIDMETGILTHVYDGKEYSTHHPDSGNQITGLTLPHWDEIIALSKEVSRAFPLEYLGIDIVIDREMGPTVLEINVRPGLGIQMANKKGLKKEILRKIEV
ncbi:MAG: alpha-L-glutamate ligase-like protein [Balneola sp.]|nr:MAG: alpha-L-glutamate ligase-like protein [Balneola sp.]